MYECGRSQRSKNEQIEVNGKKYLINDCIFAYTIKWYHQERYECLVKTAVARTKHTSAPKGYIIIKTRIYAVSIKFLDCH